MGGCLCPRRRRPARGRLDGAIWNSRRRGACRRRVRPLIWPLGDCRRRVRCGETIARRRHQGRRIGKERRRVGARLQENGVDDDDQARCSRAHRRRCINRPMRSRTPQARPDRRQRSRRQPSVGAPPALGPSLRHSSSPSCSRVHPSRQDLASELRFFVAAGPPATSPPPAAAECARVRNRSGAER